MHNAHLAANVRDILPFNLVGVYPTILAYNLYYEYITWNINPYLGVLCLVLMALNKAFSAPRICTVDAGYLAKLTKLPA